MNFIRKRNLKFCNSDYTKRKLSYARNARVASSKRTVSSVPAWFRADSATKPIKQKENVTGRSYDSVAHWSECSHDMREVLVRVPVGPYAFSFPVTFVVTGHFVPRSFRTQVISYHFGHFVPTFIFNLVISYPVWSFRTHFVPSLVISYLLLLFSRKRFGHFVPIFLLFRTQVISYPKSFRTHFSHFVPTYKLGTN